MENQTLETGELRNKNYPNGSDRRGFLKATATLGTAMCIPSVLTQSCTEQKKSTSHEKEEDKGMPVITQRRMLGSGNYSMEVAAIGFGVMGMNHHRGLSPDRKAMIKLLHQVVEHGVTLFDTAEVYGPLINEELAGEGLHSFRDKIRITTKFGHRIINGKHIAGEVDSRPETIKRVAEESLKRLRIDTIELFYQHRFDPAVPIEDVAGAVQDLIREGKVKRFGLCEVGAEVIRSAHAVQPVTAIQSEYHLMWREPEKEVLPVCNELGIGFVPYSPLNRGFLTGSINEYTDFNNGNDNRNILPRFTPEAIRSNLRIVEELNKFGRTRGITAAQVALGWLMQKAPWIVPIPGTTKLSHLEENLRTAQFSFPRQDWNELEAAVSKIAIIGDRYPASEQKQVERK